MQVRTSLAFAACLSVLAACGGQSAAFTEGIGLVEPPIALDNELVFVDGTHHQAVLLDAASKKSPAPSPKATVELPFGPTAPVRRNGHDEALVLCVGQRSSLDADAKPAALAALDANGKLRSYDLGTTPFDTLVQSDDGRYAVVFRSKNDDGRLLNNANELAVVDLDGKAGTISSVTPKTPQSFGHTPTGAVFSPTMDIAGERRRLLVVLSAAEVTLIDLNHLDRRETIVQLGDTGRTISPVQVLFGATEPTLYVRGSASDDIFVFRLEAYQNTPGGNDFRPSINQLGGGTGPADMALFDEGGAEQLLVTAQNGAQAIVIDPRSSKATSIALTSPADHILLFTATAPHDTKNKLQRALLYRVGGQEVDFLDLADVESRRERNLETLALDAPIGSVIPLLTESKLVLLNSGTGVSVLDLAERSIAPITSSSALSTATFDANKQRLWVAPQGQPRVGTLDLMTGATDEVLLDQPVHALVPMFSAGRVAIVHESNIGYVTFIDSDAPSRETAVSVRGFFIADILDRGEK
jgi:hypothetical protein